MSVSYDKFIKRRSSDNHIRVEKTRRMFDCDDFSCVKLCLIRTRLHQLSARVSENITTYISGPDNSVNSFQEISTHVKCDITDRPSYIPDSGIGKDTKRGLVRFELTIDFVSPTCISAPTDHYFLSGEPLFIICKDEPRANYPGNTPVGSGQTSSWPDNMWTACPPRMTRSPCRVTFTVPPRAEH